MGVMNKEEDRDVNQTTCVSVNDVNQLGVYLWSFCRHSAYVLALQQLHSCTSFSFLGRFSISYVK